MTPTTGKNLIYFTLFLKKEYLEILKMGLDILIKTNPDPNFDLLFITEECYVEDIQNKLKSFKNKIHFNLQHSAVDRMKASMNKLNIVNFEKINEYNKILFLDCDAYAYQDLNFLFDLVWPENALCVYNNPDITIEKFNEKYHGLTKNTSEKRLLELSDKNILPFNAGHFAFINTAKMQKHFNNVLWLIKAWPGEYFYEQSFMNHYFALNELVDYSLLKDKISLVNLLKADVDINAFTGKYIVHFIGELNSPETKFIKIQNYYNATFPLL